MNVFEKLDASLKSGDLDDALVQHRQIPQHDNRISDINGRILDALLQARRMDDAETFARTAVQCRPKNPVANTLLGSTLQSLGKDIEAADAFGKTYHWIPTDETAKTNYASSLRRVGRDAEASLVEAEHQRLVDQSIEKLPRWADHFPVSNVDNSPTAIARNLYLDLLEKIISNVIYPDGHIESGTIKPHDAMRRELGKDIPSQAHTMIGLKRLRQTREAACQIIEQGIPGDFLEAGVWRGGACILLRGVLAAYEDNSRRVWVVDSFEGLPPPDPRFAKDAASRFDFHERPELSVSLESVKDNFRRYGLLDDQVIFSKGLFHDTLPTLQIGHIALLRLDGDLYSSTTDALVNLYDKVTPGGYVIIDDYGPVIDARRATLDFRLARGITEQMYAVDDDGAFWRKVG
jgi:O-methyltransferase